jgi:hypothetical protein
MFINFSNVTPVMVYAAAAVSGLLLLAWRGFHLIRALVEAVETE